MDNPPSENPPSPPLNQNKPGPHPIPGNEPLAGYAPSPARSTTTSSYDDIRVQVQCITRNFTDPVTFTNAPKKSTNQARRERLLCEVKYDEIVQNIRGEVWTRIRGRCPLCGTLHKDSQILLNIHEPTPIRCRNTACNHVFITLGGHPSPQPLLRRCTRKNITQSNNPVAHGRLQNPIYEFAMAPNSPSETTDPQDQPLTLTPVVGPTQLQQDDNALVENEIERTAPMAEAENATAKHAKTSPKRILKWLKTRKIPKFPYKFQSPVVRRHQALPNAIQPQVLEARSASNLSHWPESVRSAPGPSRTGEDRSPNGQNIEPDISRASTIGNDQSQDEYSLSRRRESRSQESRSARLRRRPRFCRCSSSCPCPCRQRPTASRSIHSSVFPEPKTSVAAGSDSNTAARENPLGQAADSGEGASAISPPPQSNVLFAHIHGGGAGSDGRESWPSHMSSISGLP